jgi:hypothetical protein
MLVGEQINAIDRNELTVGWTVAPSALRILDPRIDKEVSDGSAQAKLV